MQFLTEDKMAIELRWRDGTVARIIDYNDFHDHLAKVKILMRGLKTMVGDALIHYRRDYKLGLLSDEIMLRLESQAVNMFVDGKTMKEVVQASRALIAGEAPPE